MRQYKFLKYSIFAPFVLYVFLVNSFSLSENRDPYYPLSLWKLWAHVPNHFNIYDIELKTDKGFVSWKTLPRFLTSTQDKTTAVMLERWSRTIREARPEETEELARFLKQKLLQRSPGSYRIVEFEVDPVKYWKSHEPKNQRIVTEFTIE